MELDLSCQMDNKLDISRVILTFLRILAGSTTIPTEHPGLMLCAYQVHTAIFNKEMWMFFYIFQVLVIELNYGIWNEGKKVTKSAKRQ